jgi:choline monooxygenase
MRTGPWDVHADIRQAWTLPAQVYTDAAVYEAARTQLFPRTWQFVADTDCVPHPEQVHPCTLLAGCLDEPLVLTRDADQQLRCLANVCTHRGHPVCLQGGHTSTLRCPYHGRRFGLDGTFQHMPAFEGVVGFPTAQDNLPQVPLGRWGQWLFAALTPAFPFEALIGPMQNRLGWLPLHAFTYDATRSRDYLVRANWALYVENYLDALHLPFVHPALAGALDYAQYRTELWRYGTLQRGITTGTEDMFALPADSPDVGQCVTAYYIWLFPNTMFNFYPWGLSLNVVQPLSVDTTRVSFLRYVWDPTKVGAQVSADAAVEQVEREDEAVVEAVQQGVRSRLYTRGRYSPTHEQGTHHFHRLLAAFLNGVTAADSGREA